MRYCIAALAVGSMACLAQGATVDQVEVRQQWPWSTDVRVDYKLSDVTGPVDLTVRVFDGTTELTLPRSAIKSDIFGVEVDASGNGSLTIDPVAAFGAGRQVVSKFRVQIEAADSPTNIKDELYRIYDLVHPSCESITRRDILNGKYGAYVTDYKKLVPDSEVNLDDVLIWTDVTNNIAYKTDKLVLRRITAASKTFKMYEGDSDFNSGNGANVSFSHDYWIGVFELTQAQFNHIKRYLMVDLKQSMWFPFHYPDFQSSSSASATNPDLPYAYETNSLYAATRAQNSLTVNTMRPSADWPTSKVSQGFNNGHWIGALRTFLKSVTGATEYFDLPTSAQWEYACRGGTAGTDLYTGKSATSANLKPIERIEYNSVNCLAVPSGVNERDCDLNSLTGAVGQYMPNAYGLYDMLGNVRELVLDGASRDYSAIEGQTDYKGVAIPGWWYYRRCMIRPGRTSTSATCYTVNNIDYTEATVSPSNWWKARWTGARLVLHTHDF